MTDQEPLREISNGTVYYFEGGVEDPVKHEGPAEIYPNWVRLITPITTWVPRDRVEQIHES
jgi:hypothetical protein